MLEVVARSFTEPEPGLQNYARLVDDAALRRIIWTTVRISLVVTAIAVVLGYVLA